MARQRRCVTHRKGCVCREANWREVARQLDEARAENAQLLDALNRYGRHTNTCEIRLTAPGEVDASVCDCGFAEAFRAALAAVQGQGG